MSHANTQVMFVSVGMEGVEKEVIRETVKFYHTIEKRKNIYMKHALIVTYALYLKFNVN